MRWLSCPALGVVLWSCLLLGEVSASRVPRRADRKCEAQSECRQFNACPQLRHLLRPPTHSSLLKLRKLTCGRTNSRTKVCCPPLVRSIRPPPPAPASQPGKLGEALLPRRCGTTIISDKLHGGTAAPLGAFPWMVVLGYAQPGGLGTHWGCGGTLISDRYVLTAAHCTVRAMTNYMDLSTIRVGENNLSTDRDCEATHRSEPNCAPPVQDFQPEAFIRHPLFNTRSKLSDDVALIRLNKVVQLNAYVGPICLPPAGSSIASLMADRKEVVVTGFGDTESGTRSLQLLQVVLPLVPLDTCREAADYNKTMPRDGVGQVCYGGNFQQDSCFKDSGGPAMVFKDKHGPPYIQVGLVSYGSKNCGVEGVPGVYADVTAYRAWIVGTLRP